MSTTADILSVMRSEIRFPSDLIRNGHQYERGRAFVITSPEQRAVLDFLGIPRAGLRAKQRALLNNESVNRKHENT